MKNIRLRILFIALLILLSCLNIGIINTNAEEMDTSNTIGDQSVIDYDL